jgi:hypothetical protein
VVQQILHVGSVPVSVIVAVINVSVLFFVLYIDTNVRPTRSHIHTHTHPFLYIERSLQLPSTAHPGVNNTAVVDAVDSRLVVSHTMITHSGLEAGNDDDEVQEMGLLHL